MKTDFVEGVYQVVASIPYGKVLTYGMVARLAGYPNYPRMVSRALHMRPKGVKLPCHRVVNNIGRLAPCWPLQAELLESEGIEIKNNGCVNLKRHLWVIDGFNSN